MKGFPSRTQGSTCHEAASFEAFRTLRGRMSASFNPSRSTRSHLKLYISDLVCVRLLFHIDLIYLKLYRSSRRMFVKQKPNCDSMAVSEDYISGQVPNLNSNRTRLVKVHMWLDVALIRVPISRCHLAYSTSRLRHVEFPNSSKFRLGEVSALILISGQRAVLVNEFE